MYALQYHLRSGYVFTCLFCVCRYRLRSKVEIENVGDDFSCWQRYGGNLSKTSSDVEEPEAASVGWGSGVDRSAVASSHGNHYGYQWYKDPRLDCLGFRGIFPSNRTREILSLRCFCNLC